VWTPVQPPSASGSTGQHTAQGATAGQSAGPGNRAAQTGATSSASQRNLSGATGRPWGQSGQGAGSRSESFSQLENDRQARVGGAQRFQQYGAGRGGGFAGAGARAGGFRR